jgi:two-component system chemotaxis response regulator CheB
MIVDDSLVYRRLLSEVMDDIAGVEVCASAPNGRVALERLETTACDVVLLDVMMPELDGVETLRQIKKRYPAVDVVMVSAVSREAADETFKALELGAVEFVAKPETKDAATSRQQLVQVLRPILSYCRTQRNLARAHQLLPLAAGAEPNRKPVYTRRVSIVVIGVSTGGPNALAQVLPELDGDLPVPVIVVQHMPASFTQSLAGRLGQRGLLRVSEALDGQRLEAGSVVVAPGGRHLTVCRLNGHLVVRLNDDPPVNGCRPSVDVCLHSLAGRTDGRILSVTMTGMGKDGVEGVRSIKSNRVGGGYSIVQTVASSVATSMPRAMVESGLADEVLPLCWIARRINALVKDGAWSR